MNGDETSRQVLQKQEQASGYSCTFTYAKHFIGKLKTMQWSVCVIRVHFKELCNVFAVALHHSELRAQSLLQGVVGIITGAPPSSEQEHDF